MEPGGPGVHLILRVPGQRLWEGPSRLVNSCVSSVLTHGPWEARGWGPAPQHLLWAARWLYSPRITPLSVPLYLLFYLFTNQSGKQSLALILTAMGNLCAFLSDSLTVLRYLFCTGLLVTLDLQLLYIEKPQSNTQLLFPGKTY